MIYLLGITRGKYPDLDAVTNHFCPLCPEYSLKSLNLSSNFLVSKTKPKLHSSFWIEFTKLMNWETTCQDAATFFEVTSSFSGFPHLQPRVQQWWGVGPHGQVQLCLWRGHRVRPVHPDLQLPRERLPLRREPQPLWGCGVWKGHGGLLNVTGKTIYL